MVPLPPQPQIPILAIFMVILALSIAIVPLAILISIPLVFQYDKKPNKSRIIGLKPASTKSPY